MAAEREGDLSLQTTALNKADPKCNNFPVYSSDYSTTVSQQMNSKVIKSKCDLRLSSCLKSLLK